MNIIITDTSNEDGYKSVEMTNGKQKVFVGRGGSGQITVLNMNASHKAYRGSGRFFWTIDAAVAAYKSEFMKDAISLAQDYI